MRERIVTLDVREDIRLGGEPFSKIMQAIERLRGPEALLLIAPFEPTPLIEILARQGFSHRATPTSSGDWEILFRRGSAMESRTDPPAETKPPSRTKGRAKSAEPLVQHIDARGLEPPQPMVTILEALANLPEDGELRAHTDRRPAHLFAQLKERGFVASSQEQDDGTHITSIRRG